MKLWLMRHGEAVDPDMARSDFERSLSARGRSQVRHLAEWLLAREEAPQLILHSPLVRARETAQTFATAFRDQPVVLEEPLMAPGIRTSLLLNRLKTAGVKGVLCVGHQPDMSRCAAEIMGGGNILYSPGTVALIEFGPDVTAGLGHFRGLIDPNWFE